MLTLSFIIHKDRSLNIYSNNAVSKVSYVHVHNGRYNPWRVLDTSKKCLYFQLDYTFASARRWPHKLRSSPFPLIANSCIPTGITVPKWHLLTNKASLLQRCSLCFAVFAVRNPRWCQLISPLPPASFMARLLDFNVSEEEPFYG